MPTVKRKSQPLPLVQFIMITALLFSCNNKQQSDPNKGHTDSIAVIRLPAPNPVPPTEAARMRLACEQWYDSILKPSNFNGGMLVAKNGNIIFEKYSGTGHLGGTDTINAHTPTHIASVSKTFTAMAVLKLVQENKLMLDDEFSKYFPSFNYPGVTVRDLLCHRSGLPNYTYFMDNPGWDKKTFFTNLDVLNHLVDKKSELKDIGTPGKHFSYCNTNYVLLALLIEKITAMSYPEYIRKTFFLPLEMNDSFVYTDADSARANPSYDWRGTLIPVNALDHIYGDKNIYTTARDLLKWDRLLATNIIFNPGTLALAYAPYSNEHPGIRNYGLGWRMNIYPDGRKLIYHNGWWHGNNASFIRILDEDATIIAMGNRFTRATYKTKYLTNLFWPGMLNMPEDEAENIKPDSSAHK